MIASTAFAMFPSEASMLARLSQATFSGRIGLFSTGKIDSGTLMYDTSSSAIPRVLQSSSFEKIVADISRTESAVSKSERVKRPI
jgi:hypothetical protein